MNLHLPTSVTYALVCSKVSMSFKTICRSIQRQHDRKCSAMCVVLGKKEDKKNRRQHLITHNSEWISFLRLKHEESLRKHLKRHEDTFANCPICNKVLQNKHSLGNHIRSVHGERSHQCTLCDKAFKKAIVLKVR